MKILIPTRNRPTSLRGLLEYLARFYPEADILVADGSTPEFQQQNEAYVASLSTRIDYRAYDEEIGLFERLSLVLDSIDDEFITMNADDDYPILETLELAERRLAETPGASFAGGHLIHININSVKSSIARLDAVRDITTDDVADRLLLFGAFPFTTSYGVARRELLVERYQFLQTWTSTSFFDLAVGLMDLIHGKFVSVPEFAFLCTRNEVHSYYRPEDGLAYLRNASKVLDLNDHLVKRVVAAGHDFDDATEVVGSVIARRLGGVVGHPPFRLQGFADTYPYNTPEMADARDKIAELFTEGTAERAKYADKLAFIAANVQATLTSTDNAGEEAVYGTL
ncbi:TIGR00180 family glycosyltransferase [Nocardioides humilatus]|uniref:TIGR00180 family glycosyltransferase n=1 Tax=Nocardioides humilatus TaxID=2607660 RepID=A0A5B1LI00_9ACTN|nr:TIGR00180 family glycosyltransferase [Nocardioides humilatus]KAA1419430.1 TIGR00180 family glycosyltransferase [Nocardioides humilatus]